MSIQRLCAADSANTFQFQGKWSALDVAQLGIVGSNCSQVMAPIIGSNNTGAGVTFNGSTISVFAAYVLSKDGDIPLVVTAIDNSSVSPAIPLTNITNGTISSIYTSPSLSLGSHDLELGVVLSPGTAFYLDTVEITMSTEQSPQAGAGGSKVPIGPIVGGVVGGLALVVCSILAFYYLYWRKRHAGRSEGQRVRDIIDFEKPEEDPFIGPQSAVVPFVMSPAPPSQAGSEAGHAATGNGSLLHRQLSDATSQSTPSRSASASTSGVRVMNPDSVHHMGEAITTMEGSGGKHAEAYRARSLQAVVMHHNDSGMRFAPGDQSAGAGPSTQMVEDVPPVYTES